MTSAKQQAMTDPPSKKNKRWKIDSKKYSSSKKNQQRKIDSKKASDKDKEDNYNEVNKLWDVVSTGKEQVVYCCVHGCIGQAVATWSSYLNPKHKKNLCNKYQLEEMRGKADKNNNFIVEDEQEEDKNDNDNDKDNDSDSDDEQGEEEDKNKNNWLLLIKKKELSYLQ